VHINLQKYTSRSNKLRLLFPGIAVLIFNFNLSLSAQNQFTDTKIGVVFSEKTWKEIHSSDQNYYFIQAWELFFLDRKITYSVFTDDQLDNYEFEDMDILILPGVEYLSDDASMNLKEFVSEGKSVFILGDIGNYKSQYRKRLDNVCDDLIKLQPIEMNNLSQSVQTVRLFSNNPFIRKLNDQNLSLLNNPESFYIKNNYETTSLGYYLNKNSADTKSVSAISYGTSGKSRYVWMGFQLSQISPKILINGAFENLILSSLNYLSNKPLVSLNNFPSSYKHAIIFINEIKDAKGSINKIKESKLSDEFLFDNFITPEALEDGNINDLKEFGNINLIFDQMNYLNNSAESINEIFQSAKKKIKMFAAQNDFGIYDTSPFPSKLAKDSIQFDGYSFRIYDDSKIVYTDGENVFSFKKLVSSSNIYKNNIFDKEIPDEQLLVYTFINDFYKLQILTGDQFKKFKINLVQNNFWITTFEKLWDWYNSTQNILIMAGYSDNDIELIVKNNNPNDISDLCVNLILPLRFTDPSVSRVSSSISFDYTTHQYRLNINEIHAHEEMRLKISE
jgi:hypothetical protein